MSIYMYIHSRGGVHYHPGTKSRRCGSGSVQNSAISAVTILLASPSSTRWCVHTRSHTRPSACPLAYLHARLHPTMPRRTTAHRCTAHTCIRTHARMHVPARCMHEHAPVHTNARTQSVVLRAGLLLSLAQHRVLLNVLTNSPSSVYVSRPPASLGTSAMALHADANRMLAGSPAAVDALSEFSWGQVVGLLFNILGPTRVISVISYQHFSLFGVSHGARAFRLSIFVLLTNILIIRKLFLL